MDKSRIKSARCSPCPYVQQVSDGGAMTSCAFPVVTSGSGVFFSVSKKLPIQLEMSENAVHGSVIAPKMVVIAVSNPVHTSSTKPAKSGSPGKDRKCHTASAAHAEVSVIIFSGHNMAARCVSAMQVASSRVEVAAESRSEDSACGACEATTSIVRSRNILIVERMERSFACRDCASGKACPDRTRTDYNWLIPETERDFFSTFWRSTKN